MFSGNSFKEWLRSAAFDLLCPATVSRALRLMEESAPVGARAAAAARACHICVIGDAAFERAHGPRALAIFMPRPPPEKNYIVLKSGFARFPDSEIMLSEQLTHEGTHAAQYVEDPNSFRQDSPNFLDNKVKHEREAFISGMVTAVSVAQNLHKSAPETTQHMITAWSICDAVSHVFCQSMRHEIVADANDGSNIDMARTVATNIFDRVIEPFLRGETDYLAFNIERPGVYRKALSTAVAEPI